MKICWVLIFLYSSLVGFSQTNFRTNGTGGGNWNANATWQIETPNGSAIWIPATSTPSATSTAITVRSTDNVTITATTTISAPLQVDGTISATNAGVTFSGATFTNNGTVSFTNNTTTFNTTSSLSGTGTYNFNLISVAAAGSLTFSRPFTANGTITVNGSVTTNSGFTANGAVTVNTGASWTANNSAFSIAGTLTATGTGTFTTDAAANGTISGNLAGSGSITCLGLTTFNGTTSVTGGLKIFNNVTINSTKSVSATSTVSIVVNGNLIQNGTINFSAGTWTFNGTSKTLSGGGPQTDFFALTIAQNASITSSLTFTTGGLLTVSGNFTTNSLFTANGAITVSGTAPAGNLTTNASFSAAGAVTVNGTLNSNAGFNAQGALTVTTAGATLITATSPFSVNGTLTVSAGGVLTANTAFDALNALTVTGANSVLTANNPFTVGGVLTVTTNGVFNANSDGVISANFGGTGTFTSTALITFDSNTQFSGTGTKNFKDILVTGNLTSINSIVLNVSGNLTNNGSINLTSGTLTMNGSNNLITTTGTPSNSSFNNLAFGNNSIITSTVALNAIGTLNITGTIPIGSFTTQQPVTVGGNVTVGGTLNSNNGFTAASNVTVSATTGSLTSTGAVFAVIGALTINGTASFQAGLNASGNVTVAVTTGTLSTSNVATNIGGTLAVNGTYNANSNLRLSSSIGNNFTLGASGNFTSTATVIFDGTTTMTTTAGGIRSLFNIQVNSGRILTGSSGTGTSVFSVRGNVTNNGGTINLTGGTLTFNGTGTSLITGTSPLSTVFNAITINGTAALVVDRDITINGNLIIDGAIGVNASNKTTFGTSIISGSGAGIKSFWHVTVAATRSLTPNIDIAINGDITADGNIVASSTSGTIFLPGTTNITGAGTVAFKNLTITGTLLSSPGTVTIWGDLTNNGTCNLSSGTIAFSSTPTTLQNIRGSQDITLNNLTISNVVTVGTNPIDISNEVAVGKKLNLVGRLTFSETNVIFDSNGASNDRVFVLLSSADSPTKDGTIGPITTGSSISSGGATPVFTPITVQRYMSSENRIWRYISAPVVGSSVADLKNAFPVTGTFQDPSACASCSLPYLITSPSLFEYKESAIQNYAAYPQSGLASAAQLTSGRGYTAYVRQDGLTGPAVINFTGTHPNTATLGYIPLAISPVANGVSLVGNPYPSAITWNPEGGTAAGYPPPVPSININTTVKVRNNGTGGPTFVDVAPGGTIAAGQAFWVTTLAAGGGVLRINENAKTAVSNTFYREGGELKDELVIEMYKPSIAYKDVTTLRVQNNALQSIDNFDSPKWDNKIQDGPNQFDLSSLTSDGKSVSTNSVPSVICGQSINLKIADLLYDANGASETNTNYTLSINPTGALKALAWILHDNATGQDINLSATPFYNFAVVNTDASSKASNRFSITASSETIDASNSIAGSSTVCIGSSASITIANSQMGMTYGVEVNGIYYPNLGQGNGNNLSLAVEPDKLSNGLNTIRVKVNSGCQEQFLTSSIEVNYTDPYQVGSVTNASICQTGSVTLSASGAPSDAVYNWYESSSSSQVLATGTEFITPILSESKSYYVAARNLNGCEGDRLQVNAGVIDLASTVDTNISSNTVCKGQSVVLSAVSTKEGGIFNWYESDSSILELASGENFTTPALQNSRQYYVSYKTSNNCESAKLSIPVNVNSFEPTISAQSAKQIVCIGESHVLTVNGAGPNASYQWFETATSIMPLLSEPSFETPSLISNRVYFVSAINDLGCASPRIAIDANVDTSDPSQNIIPTIDKVCQDKSVTLSMSGAPAGSYFNWYFKTTDSNPIATGITTTWENLSFLDQYAVSTVNANGCEGTKKQFDLSVVRYINAQIDSTSNGILKSNYLTGNNWYFNNSSVSIATSNTIRADQSGVYTLRVSISGGCETSVDWNNQISITTGLEDVTKTINVYPNPSVDFINILVEDHDKISVHLINLNGAILGEIPLHEVSKGWEGALDVRTMAKGIYFLRLSTSNKSVTHKVILQ